MEDFFKKRYYLIFISSILGPMSTNSLIPFFEELRVHFGLEVIAQVSMIFFFYILPFAIFQLFTGTYSDIVDKKKVVYFGYIIFLTGQIISLIAVLTRNYFLFFFAYLTQGIGFSFINPSILAIISEISPNDKKGFLMGIYSAAAGIGITIGGLISRILGNYQGGWMYLFIIMPIFCIIGLVAFIYSLKNYTFCVNSKYKREENEKKLNFAIKSTLNHLREGINLRIILLGFLGFFCFYSIITLSNTVNEQIRISFNDLSNIEVSVFVSTLLMIGGITGIIVGPLSGLFLRKIKPQVMIITGYSILSLMFIISYIKIIFYFMAFYLFLAIGSSIIWPALFKISMDVEPQKRGINSSIVNSLRFFGYSLVGPFYLIFGIPGVYFIVMSFALSGIIIVFIISKQI
ncbi:MAG: MFS transporter [Promethearchaeia archaeon]